MSQGQSVASITEHFSSLEDPRLERNKEHAMIDILSIAICAVICGADDFMAIERFGKSKQAWLGSFLKLPNGIPSHDTFNRVFSLISPKKFQACFTNWVQAIVPAVEADIVAIDGKTLRRSYDRQSNKAAIHMVSAWAAKNRVVLGQVKTQEKSNEITAIPELLQALEITGCMVTIDAMGCQKAIAKTIVDKGADYVLALKGNQDKLHREVEALFEQANEEGFDTIQADYYESRETNRGREEIRRHWTTHCLGQISNKAAWESLRVVGMVESQRCVDGETTLEYRYYIASLEENNAERFADAVRSHWGIENSLHWVLDVAFREDDSRIRTGNGQENFALLRHIALNLLQQETSAKVGIKNKRLSAGWDDKYLAKVLSGLSV